MFSFSFCHLFSFNFNFFFVLLHTFPFVPYQILYRISPLIFPVHCECLTNFKNLQKFSTNLWVICSFFLLWICDDDLKVQVNVEPQKIKFQFSLFELQINHLILTNMMFFSPLCNSAKIRELISHFCWGFSWKVSPISYWKFVEIFFLHFFLVAVRFF